MADIFNVLDANNFTREFIKKSILETNPDIDVSSNSAFDDLFITPIIPIIKKLVETVSNIDYKSNLKYASLLSESELDEIGRNNYFCPRKEGAKSQGIEIFKFKDIANETTIVIPAGVILTDDSESYRFYTTSRIVLSHEDFANYYDDVNMDYRVPVPISAAKPGRGYNLDAGKITKCLTTFSTLLIGVTNSTPLTGGESRESNEEYAYRLSNFYASQHLGMPKGYMSDALSVSGITSAKVVGKGDPLMERDKIYVVNPDMIKKTETTINGYDELNKEYMIDPSYIRYDEETKSYRISDKYLQHIGYGGKVDIYVKGTGYEAQQTTYDISSPLYLLGIKVTNIDKYNSKLTSSQKDETTFYLEVSDTGKILTYYTPTDFFAASTPPEYIALFDNSEDKKTLQKYNNETTSFESIDTEDANVSVQNSQGKNYMHIAPGDAEIHTAGIECFGKYILAKENTPGCKLVVPNKYTLLDVSDISELGLSIYGDTKTGYVYKNDDPNVYVYAESEKSDNWAFLVVDADQENNIIRVSETTNAYGVIIGVSGFYASKKEGPFTPEDFNKEKSDGYPYLILEDGRGYVSYEKVFIPMLGNGDQSFVDMYVTWVGQNNIVSCDPSKFSNDSKINDKIYYYIENIDKENGTVLNSEAIEFEVGDYVINVDASTLSTQITSKIKLSTELSEEDTEPDIVSICLFDELKNRRGIEFCVSDRLDVYFDDGENKHLIHGMNGLGNFTSLLPDSNISNEEGYSFIQFDYNGQNNTCALYWSMNSISFVKVGDFSLKNFGKLSGIMYSVKNNETLYTTQSIDIFATSILSSKLEEQYRYFEDVNDTREDYILKGESNLFSDGFSVEKNIHNVPAYYKTAINVLNDSENNKVLNFALSQNWDTRYNYFDSEWDSAKVQSENKAHRHSMVSIPLSTEYNNSLSNNRRITLKYRVSTHIGPELYCVDGDYMKLSLLLKNKLSSDLIDEDNDVENGGLSTTVKRPISAYGNTSKERYESYEANLDAISDGVVFEQSMMITKYTTGKDSSALDYLRLPNTKGMSYNQLIDYAEKNDIYTLDCVTESELRVRVFAHSLSLKADKLYNLSFNSLKELATYLGYTNKDVYDIGMKRVKECIYAAIASFIIVLCSSGVSDVDRYARRINSSIGNQVEDVYTKREKKDILLDYFEFEIVQKIATAYIPATTSALSSFDMLVSANNQEGEYAVELSRRSDTWTYIKVVLDFGKNKYQMYSSPTGNVDEYYPLGDEETIGVGAQDLKELLIDFSWYFDNTVTNYSRMRYSGENYFRLDDISIVYEDLESSLVQQVKNYRNIESVFRDSIPTFIQGYTIVTTKDSDDAIMIIRDSEYNSEYKFNYRFVDDNESISESTITITGMAELDSISENGNHSLYTDIWLPSPTNDLFSLKYDNIYGEEYELERETDGLINYELKHYNLHWEDIDKDSVYYQSSQEQSMARVFLNNPFKLEYDDLNNRYYTKFPYINKTVIKLGHSTNVGLFELGKKYNYGDNRIITTDVLVKESDRTYINIWIEVSTSEAVVLSEVDKSEMIALLRSYISTLPVNSETQMSDIVEYLGASNFKKYIDYIKLPFRSFYTTTDNNGTLVDQNYIDVDNVLRAGENKYFELGQCRIIQL